ncbi:hypothetical protein [Hymenobacter rubripertinctus]|uniref:Uncharacterized protein n=1 Tax=Hymenobacter rubripertinctus TaxID=2029981 RepID=A0A418QQV4_9BACT|nr:hypothetical protein [Hymenobacter rubripertinctus]RIY07491.1 hypothetical protein D0T11_16230 [Hymenobacter rubripertinctus]
MKKPLLSITALLYAFALKAQTVNDVPLKDIDVEYVQIVGTSKLLSTKLTIEIDFGQKTKFFSSGKETIVKDADGKPVDFNSMIDALNFMSKNGYNFVNAYTITVANQNVYHYLMRNKKSKSE